MRIGESEEHVMVIPRGDLDEVRWDVTLTVAEYLIGNTRMV